MSFIQRLLAPLASAATGVGIMLGGAPPELAAIGATSVGQLVQGFLPTGRPRAQVVADETYRANRAQAYEAFGASTAMSWQAAGLLVTFRPGFVGYIHGLALLVRAQRRFEEQVAATTAALGNVLLYGSLETQETALALFKTLGEQLAQAGSAGNPGSAASFSAFEAASLEFGNKMVAWRKAAQADLGYTVA